MPAAVTVAIVMPLPVLVLWTLLTRSATPEMLPHEIFEFTDSRQAEILARCCRVWVSRDVLDDEFVHLADAVIKVGLRCLLPPPPPAASTVPWMLAMLHCYQLYVHPSFVLLPSCTSIPLLLCAMYPQCALVQLPKDPYIIVLHSSFLIDVQGSYQSGYSALQAAKKQDPSFLMRYAIFTREQQHMQKSANASGAGGRAQAATDLVTYVEFQRNYRWGPGPESSHPRYKPVKTTHA
jgi:hypothetical protein